MAKAREHKDDTGPTDDAPGRELTVRRSRVRLAGSTRIHESVLSELGLDKGDVVDVGFGPRHLALHLYADAHVRPDHIVLRHPDLERLGAHEGDRVRVRPHVRSWAALRRGTAKIGHRLAKRLDLDDEAAAAGPRGPAGEV